ncbi:Sterile alpha and TIR motif-containing protein 1 [Ilyodon furcidens]|uniref:Sterile alpha and TIR motif-containing protein 1 n=1 Tax=Ilyodon furcidens TaxID=33524 RepID=A0ABV0TBQ3_9TELE
MLYMQVFLYAFSCSNVMFKVLLILQEIVTALAGKKNIVPVTDNFMWPNPTSLPEDMRPILNFNGIKWSHEYQEATIEKIIRFLKGRHDTTDAPDESKEQKK